MYPAGFRRWSPLAAVAALLLALLAARARPVQAAGAAVIVHRLAGPITVAPGKGVLFSCALGNTSPLTKPLPITLTFRNANGAVIATRTDEAIGGVVTSELDIDPQGQISVDDAPHGNTSGNPLLVEMELTTRPPRTLSLSSTAQLIDPGTNQPEGIIAILIGL
jgi:hypothetical protein